MRTRLLLLSLSILPLITQKAHGCTRDLTMLFWSPIIDKVSGDCSFVGFEPNPSGIVFTSVIGVVAIGVVVWRTRK